MGVRMHGMKTMRRGVTLIELMVVMAVVIVLTGA